MNRPAITTLVLIKRVRPSGQTDDLGHNTEDNTLHVRT